MRRRRHIPGTFSLQRKLEQRIASFVGKENAIIFPMGYGTNSTSLPAIAGPVRNERAEHEAREMNLIVPNGACAQGGLIISDSLNHASIVVGCRTSGAKIKTFKHNGTNPRSSIRSACSVVVV